MDILPKDLQNIVHQYSHELKLNDVLDELVYKDNKYHHQCNWCNKHFYFSNDIYTKNLYQKWTKCCSTYTKNGCQNHICKNCAYKQERSWGSNIDCRDCFYNEDFSQHFDVEPEIVDSDDYWNDNPRYDNNSTNCLY